MARFVQIPSAPVGHESPSGDLPMDFLTLEELTQNHLEDCSRCAHRGSYPFRVTRDMDIDILEDEASDLLSAVDREVRRRKFGAAVRLEVSRGFLSKCVRCCSISSRSRKTFTRSTDHWGFLG